MTKPAGGDNILSIQYLRGIAAFMVLLCHSCSGDSLAPANVLRQFSSYGWMGVEMFFIISGFIIPYSMYNNEYKTADFGHLMLRRLVRIEPPYIISIVLLLLFYYGSYLNPWGHATQPPAPVDWANVLGHLGYINAFTGRPWLDRVYWTLAVEFEFYIILGLVYELITSSNKVVLFGAHFLLLASTFLMLHVDSMVVKASHILFFFPFFLLGIALFLLRTGKVSRSEFIVLLLADSAICFKDHGLILLLLSLATLLFIHFVKRRSVPLLWLGNISFSLYLTHVLYVSRVMALTGKVAHNGYVGLRLALTLAVCLVMAYIYYVVVEKPFIKLSKRIRYLNQERKIQKRAAAAAE